MYDYICCTNIYIYKYIYIYSKHIVNRMNYTASLVVIIYMLYYHDMDMNVKNIYRHKYRYIFNISIRLVFGLGKQGVLTRNDN